MSLKSVSAAVALYVAIPILLSLIFPCKKKNIVGGGSVRRNIFERSDRNTRCRTNISLTFRIRNHVRSILVISIGIIRQRLAPETGLL